MVSFTFETVLCVDNYYDETDPECDAQEAFDSAASDYEGVRILAGEDLMEHLTDQQMATVKITSMAFIEFDSSNVSHAGAYFEVHCEAPQDVVDALTGEDKLIQPEMED